MANPVFEYNHTAAKILEIPFTEDASNFRIALLKAETIFDARHTHLNQVTGYGTNEVWGYGWPQGGAALINARIETYNTNRARFKADNVSHVIDGGSIIAYFAVIYCNERGAGSALSPLWWISFDGLRYADRVTPFEMTFSDNGLVSMAPAFFTDEV
jgi:hypothetical protein